MKKVVKLLGVLMLMLCHERTQEFLNKVLNR